MEARNQAGIGLSYRPASLCSLATQFQTRFLELILCPIAGLKFPTLGSLKFYKFWLWEIRWCGEVHSHSSRPHPFSLYCTLRLPPLWSFFLGKDNLSSFDLGLTLGRFLLYCLILVWVLNKDARMLLVRRKLPLIHSHYERKDLCSDRPIQKLNYRSHEHSTALSSASGEAEIVNQKFFLNPRSSLY